MTDPLPPRPGGHPRAPIAIVGIGCRFPGGVSSPESFWRALLSELDAIGEIPQDRFDAEALYKPYPPAPGKIGTRWGGYLEGIDRFDADFFGIAPREADRLDPQQRLLLEVSWEALEDAGIPAERLLGTRTGVFVGEWLNDFEARLFADPSVDFYMTTGSGRYSASGRVSYALGLQGPAITVDTACSSSLVAVHLACQSLWSGECEAALAGGANVILQPHITIAYSQSSMMAPDGRCKFGDARANGYVRSEGAAVVLLKPLARALADGDDIYALIRGTAVNNDGKSGEYMATPAQAGQEEMLRLAIADAGVSPGQVAYVEAHGTGTGAGDPVEIGALGAVLAEGRPSGRPCAVGSVKTNFGHTEGAAGVAGLVKAALVLKNRTIPRSLHFQEPNPNIPWDQLPVYVPRELTPLADESGPALAGVSSFGIAGTNAHVVLEEANDAPVHADASGTSETSETAEPTEASRPAGRSAPVLVPLSARSPAALAQLARSWAQRVAELEPSLRDVAYSAGSRRAQLEERAAIVAETQGELVERLRSFADAEPLPGVVAGKRGATPRKVAFVFPGQGSQWVGMARELLATEPVFRQVIEDCEGAMRPMVTWSLMQQLLADDDSPDYALDRIDVVQPVLVAVDVALAALWRSWGVQPDAVVGHSMGEVAAAHVSGALSLADALRVVCFRSQLMRRTSGQGLMAAIEMSIDEARGLLVGYESRVSIAASNSARSTILSGEPDAVRELVSGLEARDVFCRLVNVDVASHSPQMEPLRGELVTRLIGLRTRPSEVPMFSTVLARTVRGEELDPSYWSQNLRQPVLFATAVERLLDEGFDTFIEMSPHPVLLPAIEQTVRARARTALTLPSLRRQEPERATMLGSVGTLWVSGGRVDFARVSPPGRFVRFPTYPWQRERFWHEPAPRPTVAASRSGSHPLLGPSVRSAAGGAIWETEIGTGVLPWLADHRVRGRAVLPAAAFVEIALSAADTFAPGASVVTDITFAEALFLPEDGTSSLQVVLEPEAPGIASVRVYARGALKGDASTWTLHARATVVARGSAEDAASSTSAISPTANGLRPEGAVIAVVENGHYAAMTERGLDYGPAFRGLGEVTRMDGVASAPLDLPDQIASEDSAYRLHPALLDACFQLALETLSDSADPTATFLPSALERMVVDRRLVAGEPLRARATRRAETRGQQARNGAGVSREDRNVLIADVDLFDADGGRVASARGLRFHRLAEAKDASGAGWLYRPEWIARPRSESSSATAEPTGSDAAGRWLVLADSGRVGATLARHLERAGASCVLAAPGDDFWEIGPGRYFVNPSRPEDLARLVRAALESDRDVNGEANGVDGAVGHANGAAHAPVAPSLTGIVHLWTLDTSDVANQESEASTAIERGVVTLLHLVQAITDGMTKAPRLALVTAGAQPVLTGDAVRPLPALIWGMAGVLAHEHPELQCTSIDLDPAAPSADVIALLDELRSTEREERVAFRRGARYVSRLVRHESAQGSRVTDTADAGTPSSRVTDRADAKEPNARVPDASVPGQAHATPASRRPYRVVTTAPGVLDRLIPRFTPRRPPAAGQIEIEVRATGLNFMNVMSALGIYPGYPNGLGPLGIECAGVVTAVGARVYGFRKGDEVVAYAFDSLASHALADQWLVVLKPSSLSFAEAATLPIAFLTAHYALNHLAHLERDERVLIHSATGGVGLAALQLARRVGAEVFATAGSEQKRAYLRSLGIEEVFDSRSLDFADQILDRTDGEGVDVVLNSLSGAAITRGLSVLRPYGRFIEIGKRDIYEDSRVGLAPFKKGLSYFAVDLERMARERPAVLGPMLSQLILMAGAGELRALPFDEYAVSDVADAFRQMAQAKHVGKVVVRIQDSSELAGRIEPPASPIRSDASYLITGGLGGLGLQIARWMAEQGAGHLALVGRRDPSEAALQEILAIESMGTAVAIAKGDVSERSEVAAVFDRIDAELPPLRGVVHAAGVLADGTVLGTDRDRFVSALGPKVHGALHLDALTRHRDLDFFVLFSSVTALLGTPGQSNYAAANAFLDALAHTRRAAGLPATSINWGPWSEVGLAAARTDRGERLSRQGLASLTPAQGVSAFARLLGERLPQVAVMRLDLNRWSELHPAAAGSAFFEELRRNLESSEPAEVTPKAGGGIRDQVLAAALEVERRALLEKYVQEQVAHVLRLASSRVATDRPLKSLGMDSLMTLELRNRLEVDLGITLPASVVWNYPTVTLLAGHLVELMAPSPASSRAEAGEAAPPPPSQRLAPTSTSPPPATELDELSAAELRRLLADELAGVDDLLKET